MSNLRGGPGTAYDVVGVVTSDDELQVTGRSEDGTWLVVGRSNLSQETPVAALEATPEPTSDSAGGTRD